MSPNPVAGEKLFGIRTESTRLTAVAVLVLLLAALVTLIVRRRWVLLGVGGLTLVFAALDVREALHQHSEGRASLVAAAGVLAIAHLAASIIGLLAYLST